MSKIIATDHFETQNWEVTFEDLASNYADLFIGFTDDGPVVQFNDLKFGYELRQGENIKKYGVFPPPNVRYVRTDQPYIVAERLTFRPEVEYTLWLWCENGGRRFETKQTFTTPAPAQPAAPRMNINTATQQELVSLLGIGPARSQAIIEGRVWASIYDLSRIEGISADMVASWEHLIQV